MYSYGCGGNYIGCEFFECSIYVIWYVDLCCRDGVV